MLSMKVNIQIRFHLSIVLTNLGEQKCKTSQLLIVQFKTSFVMINRLRSSLEHPLLDDFIEALEMLTNPEMVFRVCSLVLCLSCIEV